LFSGAVKPSYLGCTAKQTKASNLLPSSHHPHNLYSKDFLSILQEIVYQVKRKIPDPCARIVSTVKKSKI